MRGYETHTTFKTQTRTQTKMKGLLY